jgi:hypothetical protein
VSKQFKLKLVDGNYAFAFKKPNGFDIPEGLSGKGSYWGDRFDLYFTEHHQDVVTFAKATRGALLHYKRRSESALLPEKVLPENADAIVAELGLEGIGDLYSPVYGESVIEELSVDLRDYEDMPDIHGTERPVSSVPAESKWLTYADYQPFGANYDGLLPGYLDGYSKALAKALDDRLKRVAGVQIWTHKADHGVIDGHRKLLIEGFASPYRFGLKEVSVDFSFTVGKTLEASSLEDAVRKFNANVDAIVEQLTAPMRVGLIEAAV